MNNELLPSHNLAPNLPRTISVRTANRWLHRMGLTPQSHKKGSYVDGHERENIIKSREEFLKLITDLKRSHKPPPPCSDEMAPVPGPNAEFQKDLVLIYHNKSILIRMDRTGCGPQMTHLSFNPRRSGIMVSDFVDQQNGYLQLTDEEYAVGKVSDPDIMQSARVLLEYGAEREGYWTSEKFMHNVKIAVKIVKHNYPAISHTVCWIFEQRSCHKAYAEDTLDAKRTNLRPGGAQLQM